MKKIRPIKNTWYDWLIYYIPQPIRKRVGGFKYKIVSLFKTNAPKQTVYGRGQKISNPKTQNIILKKKKKEIKDRTEIFGDFLKQKKKKRKKEIRKKKDIMKD